MGVPAVQIYRVTRYILSKKFRGIKRYPLVLMLEPLFRCNLACAGCGKIEYGEDVLDRRLTVAECLSAADECGAPVVSIAGGEPLLHKQMPEIVEGIVRRRKFVYLCTNGLLLKANISKYKPSPYLTFSIHLDGNRQRHDASVSRQGIYDVAVEAIQLARVGGFRVNINCTLYGDVTAEEMAGFFDFVTGLGIEGITVAPGFNYEHAPKQDVFLKQNESKQFFRDLFKLGKGRGWKFNHTGLYLDFLAGNENYRCTPWGNPTRNVFGWQQPCYLLMDEGYVPSFRALMEETEWEKYGAGRHPKCGHCMLHSGFEATAVNDMLAHPMKALRVFLRGADTDGPMAAEPPNPDKPGKVPKMSKVN